MMEPNRDNQTRTKKAQCNTIAPGRGKYIQCQVLPRNATSIGLAKEIIGAWQKLIYLPSQTTTVQKARFHRRHTALAGKNE
jgi:hypothetical protein